MSEDRDLLLSASALSLPREAVPVPELGAGKVIWIQGMNGSDRDAFEASLLVQKGKKSTVDTHDMRAKLVVRCAIETPPADAPADFVGKRLFRDDEYKQVSKIRGDVLGRLHEKAQALSGLTDSDLEELGKSSGTAPGDSSSSN